MFKLEKILGVASSLAQQETARALGDQNHFNYHQFWQTGLQNAESAGLSAGFGIPNPATKQEFITNLGDAEKFAISMQLLQLPYQHGKMNWKALLIAALQAPVNKMISDAVPKVPTPAGMVPTSNFALQVPSDLFDTLISQEVTYGKVDIQSLAAQALGDYLGIRAEKDAYNAYKTRIDQQPQIQWRNQQKPTNQNNPMDSLAQINANVKALNDATQKINAELAALGNINPFTGEPLDSGVTNDPNGINAVGATLRGRPQGAPDDPNANNINKNPSYTNRQVQHAATENQTQAQSYFQQQQTNLAAKGSLKLSFWQSLENSVGNYLEKVEDKQRLFNDGRYGFKQDVSNLSPELQEAYYTGASKSAHLGDKIANWEFGALGFADLAATAGIGLFALKNPRQIASIARIASDIANKPFITDEAIAEGWKPPFPENTTLRKITTGMEIKFVRVFTGKDPTGGFIVREKEIAHLLDNPEKLKTYLGLNEIPTGIADVHVPSGTSLLVGRIAAQPNFGLMENSGFQYQLLEELSEENFKNVRALQFNEVYNLSHSP